MIFKMRQLCFDLFLAAAAFAVLVLMVSPDVRADITSCPPVPDPLKNGFRSYQFKGASAAVIDWTYKSYFNNPSEMDGIVAELSAYHNHLGDVKTYHTLGVDRITPNTSVYYVGAGHERGELFFKLIYYCEKDEWILSDRPKFNSDPDTIFSQNFYLRSIKDLEEAGSTKAR